MSVKSCLDSIKLHFENTPVEEWSYMTFLESQKPIIVSEVCSLVNQKSLWRKRYLTYLRSVLATKEQDDISKRRAAFLIKEKRPPEEKTFWNNVAIEKGLLITNDDTSFQDENDDNEDNTLSDAGSDDDYETITESGSLDEPLMGFCGFQEEVVKQISIMKNLDFISDHEGSMVRDVLKIPKALNDLLRTE
ncbi:4907_t:CDS:2 [Paraglomus occultum]|uniref:4907_t:CDS:1 n=1 Tax=Paraglomus occultum TaxID=144539 RepID=A0A9N9CZC1_9GLOM|nr:4907_t:CDS:2 [Paraglomus occultum]